MEELCEFLARDGVARALIFAELGDTGVGILAHAFTRQQCARLALVRPLAVYRHLDNNAWQCSPALYDWLIARAPQPPRPWRHVMRHVDQCARHDGTTAPLIAHLVADAMPYALYSEIALGCARARRRLGLAVTSHTYDALAQVQACPIGYRLLPP